MRLINYPIEKLNNQIIQIFENNLDLKKYKIFYFGSRVLGKGDERSDIDIGIEGSNALSQDKMAEIREQIDDLPLLYKIDVVDFKNVSSDFKKLALTNIEPING